MRLFYLLFWGFVRLEGELGLPEEPCDRELRSQRMIELVQNRQTCQPIRTLMEDSAYDEDEILQGTSRKANFI